MRGSYPQQQMWPVVVPQTEFGGEGGVSHGSFFSEGGVLINEPVT